MPPSSPTNGRPNGRSSALSHIRVCDLSGQLAGAGATRFLAVVRRAGDPSRGPGPARLVGHPARRASVHRRPARHRPRRRVQQPQRREAGHHHQPPPGAGQGAAAQARRGLRRGHRELRRRRVRPHGLLVRRAPGDQARHRLRVELRVRRQRPVHQLQDVGPDRAGGRRGSPSAAAFRTCRPRGGATRTWTTWAPTTWRSRSSPVSSTATAPARANGSTWDAPRRAPRSSAPTSSTTR